MINHNIERAEFEAHFKTLNFSRNTDAWGRDQYTHSHIQSLWEGWQGRAMAYAKGIAQAAPVQPASGVMAAWEPQFDVMAPEQEELAIKFCEEISGKRGERHSLPDPVRLLEMAQELYLAERDDRIAAPSDHIVQPVAPLPQGRMAIASENQVEQIAGMICRVLDTQLNQARVLQAAREIAARFQAVPQGEQCPIGWALVPVEATYEMKCAGVRFSQLEYLNHAADVWTNMMAFVPQSGGKE